MFDRNEEGSDEHLELSRNGPLMLVVCKFYSVQSQSYICFLGVTNTRVATVVRA